MPFDGNGRLEDVDQRLRGNAQPGVGAFQQFLGPACQVGHVGSRGLAQFGSLGADGDLLIDEFADPVERSRFALEVALDGGTENPLDAAEVLLDLFDLLRHFQEEGQILFLIAAEVEDADIPHLAVTGDTAIALLELRRRPREHRSG